MNEQREFEEGEGIELTLGLSLNGKFGVDPLRRSLSISPPDLKPTGGPWASLSRTYSLPDEDSRKRKEVQMLRRLEVKRRRVEKMRNINVAPPSLSSQGSSGSGSGSGSSSSEFDGLTNTNTAVAAFSGMNRSTEVKSPQSVESLDQNEHKSLPTKLQNDLGKMAAAADTNPSRSFSDTGEMVRNVLSDMPCVSTKVNGPNGKRIDGFLYRFKKGEEVRIVCVCHGSFLTPAEFIKHAGGGDVEHPLRHIVVNSSSFFNLH